MTRERPPPPPALRDGHFTVPPDHAGAPLDRVLRALFPGTPWTRARRAIESGKVSVGPTTVTDPRTPVPGGAVVTLNLRARAAAGVRLALDVVFVDSHVVVVDKPAGLSTVPYEPGERGTLQDLVRETLKKREHRPIPPLGVVQRLDKETSGLVVFARSLQAKRNLKQEFRFHTVYRRYLALAHGRVSARTIRSRLIDNRGDGLRGSTTNPKLGQEAVTHVRPLAELEGATLVECQLETGRTHQIRIHLSEAGHPVLGERVYTRGTQLDLLEAPRLMLHARDLGFSHPVTGAKLRFSSPPPRDFVDVLVRLGGEPGALSG